MFFVFYCQLQLRDILCFKYGYRTEFNFSWVRLHWFHFVWYLGITNIRKLSEDEPVIISLEILPDIPFLPLWLIMGKHPIILLGSLLIQEFMSNLHKNIRRSMLAPLRSVIS